ncbi:tetratricopeptide repeat protein [Spirosoma sp. HMF4905]|uniref:Tetratricopeptide repeat protein n=1 Tax=Spirosoma arboris TaxID=2682092 RepID=A0A7K1SMX5_9BACT|nr:tetratricopeptide repeat protein [Spirosoma arboris]MVM35150.1 tetratricopeptide repeat protein [Spirosoma arboris]
MIYLVIAAWLWLNELLPLNQITQNNQARQEAQIAYQAGQYNRALALYVYLSKTTTTIDPAVRLNLGHTYFKLKQYAKAKPQYETLLRSDRSDLRTAAATQLGVMACLEGDSVVALTLFQQALLENADNESARYNFELIKTHYSGKVPAKNAHHQSSTQKPKLVNKPRPMGGQQVEQSDRQDELLRRFQRMNLSEEQALQLLDAMRSNDLPYALTRSARHAETKPKEGENRW